MPDIDGDIAHASTSKELEKTMRAAVTHDPSSSSSRRLPEASASSGIASPYPVECLYVCAAIVAMRRSVAWEPAPPISHEEFGHSAPRSSSASRSSPPSSIPPCFARSSKRTSSASMTQSMSTFLRPVCLSPGPQG